MNHFMYPPGDEDSSNHQATRDLSSKMEKHFHPEEDPNQTKMEEPSSSKTQDNYFDGIRRDMQTLLDEYQQDPAHLWQKMIETINQRNKEESKKKEKPRTKRVTLTQVNAKVDEILEKVDKIQNYIHNIV